MRVHSAKAPGSPLQQSGVFLVELDKLDQVFDSEVGERLGGDVMDLVDVSGHAARAEIAGRRPIPGQEFVQPMSRMRAQRFRM